MSYTKLLVCPSNSEFAARLLRAFQICCRFSFGCCLRKKKRKRSKVLLRFTRKSCPHRSNSSGKGMFATWIAGNLSKKGFRAACRIERKRMLINFFQAIPSAKPPIRTGTCSPLSVRISSMSEIECFCPNGNREELNPLLPLKQCWFLEVISIKIEASKRQDRNFFRTDAHLETRRMGCLHRHVMGSALFSLRKLILKQYVN